MTKKDREKLDQTLYEDAKRRQEENKKKKEDLDLVRDQPKDKLYKNNKSDKIVMEKFEREIKQAEQEINAEEDEN